jgi:hypothetical protein
MKLRDCAGLLPLFFIILLIKTSVFAQDNDALLSVSITNGTLVAPKSMFTQTWTLTNNGTTTWTPTQNGYTLNIISLDSLGAMQLYTNAYDTTLHHPSCIINSGKNVAPGGTATFSMEFIAPEASGSYTDSFQLNNASSAYFGQVVTAQVAVEPGGNTNVFDRSRAISFANNYAPYFCPDGYFWTNGSDYAITNKDIFALVPTGNGVDGGVGDDCAHFVSYCIGNGPYVRGGGINVPSRATPTYGEPGAGDVIYNILLTPGYGVEVSSLSQLEPGDVIGWNWEGETNDSSGYIDHVTLYMGNGLVSCHAQSLLDVAPSYFGTGPVTVPRKGWSWHLIHIQDYPTLWSSISGQKMSLSWTTNWSAYALYSAPTVNGTWTKLDLNPSKNGDTNSVTFTMTPSTASALYRLEMP